MADTTIRVKDRTYREIIKARGAFERTFGYKLTLDETMFLSSSYISFAYREFQKLLQRGLLTVVDKDGGNFDIRLSGLREITQEVLPDVVEGFQNIKKMLKEKEVQSHNVVTSGQVG